MSANLSPVLQQYSSRRLPVAAIQILRNQWVHSEVVQRSNFCSTAQEQPKEQIFVLKSVRVHKVIQMGFYQQRYGLHTCVAGVKPTSRSLAARSDGKVSCLIAGQMGGAPGASPGVPLTHRAWRGASAAVAVGLHPHSPANIGSQSQSSMDTTSQVCRCSAGCTTIGTHAAIQASMLHHSYPLSVTLE